MLGKIKMIYSKDSKMFNNIIGTTVIKCVSLLLNIYSITAYLHYFNGNQKIYGVWLTILSILNWVVNFDLGIGNGLRNRLAEAIAAKNDGKVKTLISSAYILLSIVSIIVFCFISVIACFLDWNKILNVDESIVANAVLCKAVIISLFGLCIHFILKLIISILYALKETALGSLVPLLVNILIVVYSVVMQNSNAEIAILKVSIAYAITMIFPLIIITVFVFHFKLPESRPTLRHYNHELAKSILSLGGQFFLIQILLLIINSTNEFIIVRIANPEAVVTYNIYFRLFSAIIALFSVIINPVWSSISVCYAKKDLNGILWRKKAITIIAVIFSIGSFVVSFMLQFFVNILYHESSLIVVKWYSVLFAIYTSVMLFVNSTSCVENGINDLKPQIIGNIIAASLKIPLVYVIFIYTKSWIAVMYANICIMIISLVVQKIGMEMKLSAFKGGKL